MMHPIYLPFTEQQLLSHFADVRRKGKCIKNVKHVEYYKQSIERYDKYLKNNTDRKGKPLSEMRKPCQIEKDERFWIAACMMTIFYSKNRKQELIQLFEMAYGRFPPIEGLESWEDCFDGKLHLFFEVSLPSPKSYKKWLQKNLTKRQFIPYVLDNAHSNANLEGATNVDAILLNSQNGFSVIIEAKVLSDISYEVTYNTMRDQIARNIDVMLEENCELCFPLNKRDPEKSLFLLVTPKIFKDNPSSRLYGYKFHEYKNNPNALSRDLPHIEDCNWQNISDRLGWLTWEEFKNVNKDCCKWLD
ncbi:hypothetical protein FHQ18_09135 [Deferribacter autotrophicus]|uniref:Uncharacterized protein n=1 Tax=Deferribacter autotrophicus TaxID=500465 RepID=A0A5A8F6F7_9BACT|nr:hypothetical protein [Deferribacter autotrophicus]KAA0257496.1 hypothetical protein FHQ18_09135 [Deferribacter autotrophicus]